MRKTNPSQGPHLTSQQSQQVPCQETETPTQSTAGSCSQGSQRQSTDGFPTLQVPGKARIIMFDWSKSNPAETTAGTCTEHKTQPFLSNSVTRTSPGHQCGTVPTLRTPEWGKERPCQPPNTFGIPAWTAASGCQSTLPLTKVVHKYKNHTGNCVPNRGSWALRCLKAAKWRESPSHL